jgi:hypothetical protein
MSKPAPNKTAADKRLFFFSLAVFIVVVAFVVWQMNAPRTSSNLPPVQIASTGVPPTVAVLLTQIPAQLASGDGLYEQIDTLEQMVAACSDYSDDRRLQMRLHFTWLRNPDQIPRDLLVAMGSETVGRLLLGMSTFTLQEWQARNRPADSCLVPIGQALNPLLLSTGQPAASAFD